MKKVLLLKNIKVENANAISGLTYGFPAITHFLGFTHALSRQIQQHFDIKLDACAVIAHDYHLKMHQPKGWGEHVFSLSRNPLTKEGKTAPFIEEGKMHMQVSLLINITGYLADDDWDEVAEILSQTLGKYRLAGGVITDYEPTVINDYPVNEKAIKKLLFSLLPGYVLLDRSDVLKQHYQQLKTENEQIEMLDAWLDFCAIKYQAIPKLKQSEQLTEQTKADWHFVAKPATGYLVPTMNGYKGISPLYEAGEIQNTRDPNVPFRFVEAVYGIGEWVSPHRLNDISELMWRYHIEDDFYLCKQTVNH